MNKLSAAIVIPVHKPQMDNFELVSFKRCLEVFKKYPIYLVCPENMDTSQYQGLLPGLKIQRFDDKWFKNVLGYNKLVLTPEFYEAFLPHEYILIYQLDAFVFEDQLPYWCSKGFDYIGAPWTAGIVMKAALKISPSFLLKNLLTGNSKRIVGNSGFSLRNVRSSIECLKTFKKEALAWKTHDDYFWSFFVPANYKKFKIAPFADALAFAFEGTPENCYKLNHSRLPFGCHAWNKFGTDFWRSHFKNAGFEI